LDTISKRYIWIFFSVLIVIMIAAYLINTLSPPEEKPLVQQNDENSSTGYITVTDSQGNIILETGLPVYVDDEYIDENDIRYIIVEVEGANAVARIINNAPPAEEPNRNSSSWLDKDKLIPVQANPKNKNLSVAIYHTHSDESYTPTSGKASEKGDGDILKVGKTFATNLERAGINVTHSTAIHEPHDINAYHRSRRTAITLLKEETPAAIFDVHRDSAPKKAYLTSINGIDTARIMIVIGRSNPNMQTNLEYAKSIKAAADKLHPGLMRGIFMGKGNYNQDLHPRAILFEIGTEQLSQDLADRAISTLTDAVIQVLNSQ